MMKRLLGLLGTASLVAAMATPASAIELKLAHYAPIDHPASKAADMMAAAVAKRTNGAVTIKVYPANQLGDGNEVLEQQMKGAIDISLSTQPMLDKYGDKGDKPFGVVMLPFVYKGYEHAWRVLDGPFAKWMAPRIDKLGLVWLANWEWGFRNLTNSKRPIMTPDDVKGLKIRTPGEIQLQAAMEAAGAIVTKIAFPELPMALKQGVVDGQENPLAVIDSLKLYETQKYLALTYHSYNSMTCVISKATWGKLNADQQKIVKEEAVKAGQWFRDKNLEAEKGLVSQLKAKGMQVTNPDLAAFKAKMQPAYDAIADYAGKANVDAFLKMVAETK
ncbi:MAG: TRAP transporter substrate-binding protein [Rhodospirillales bacterium]